MIVEWIRYVQSFIDKVMKGMLIGLVIMLMWFFLCEDVFCEVQVCQLVLVICDEVVDLEVVGIRIVQIDEVVFCEGLLLCCNVWLYYLEWVIEVFCLCVFGVCDEIQIYMYMCYSEFNDVIEFIVVMDVDVIIIEILCLDMELLEVFEQFDYLNEIGLGVYDIYLLCVLSWEEIVVLLCKVVWWIFVEWFWVNLDCGLKICVWLEIEVVLVNMVVVVCELCGDFVCG